VKLVGHVSDVPAAFAAADLAVVASVEPEAFGRAGAEAQAMGCPVIAARLGAPQETVLAEPDVARAQITGWLVPPGDAVALAGQLEAALGLAPTELAQIGARARQHVHTTFSLSKMKRQTLAVYDRLLGTTLAAEAEPK
jgi:glycosyltransferase involved in cell wall biosynthesis